MTHLELLAEGLHPALRLLSTALYSPLSAPGRPVGSTLNPAAVASWTRRYSLSASSVPSLRSTSLLSRRPRRGLEPSVCVPAVSAHPYRPPRGASYIPHPVAAAILARGVFASTAPFRRHAAQLVCAPVSPSHDLQPRQRPLHCLRSLPLRLKQSTDHDFIFAPLHRPYLQGL